MTARKRKRTATIDVYIPRGRRTGYIFDLHHYGKLVATASQEYASAMEATSAAFEVCRKHGFDHYRLAAAPSRVMPIGQFSLKKTKPLDRPYVTREKLTNKQDLYIYGSGQGGNYDVGVLHLNSGFEIISVAELERLRGIEAAWLQLAELAKEP